MALRWVVSVKTKNTKVMNEEHFHTFSKHCILSGDVSLILQMMFLQMGLSENRVYSQL